MNEKAKNDNLHIKNLKFFLLWVVLVTAMAQLMGIVFMWIYLWVQQFAPTEFEFWRINLLNGLLYVAFTAPTEKALLKLRFGKWIKGWISASFLSMILSAMPFMLGNMNIDIWQGSLIMALSTLPQVWVLRRYVKHAWIYPFAAGFATYISTNIAMNVVANNFGASVAYGSGMVIMALTLLWLFAHPKSEEKAKRAEAETFSRLEDGAVEGEIDSEENIEDEKSTKRRSIIGFVLYRLFGVNFWKTWQKT